METPVLSRDSVPRDSVPRNAVPTWLLVCATKPEWSPLKKQIPFKRHANRKEIVLYSGLYRGKEVWLLQTGIGTERAQRSLSILFDELKARPNMIIHFGFSGALKENLKTADMILPSEILSEEGEKETFPPSIISKTKFLLKELQLPVCEGIFYTTKTVLKTPKDKKEAGTRHGAIAVDMESFPVATFCRQKGVPLLAMRAIWDPLEWDLTSLHSLNPTTPQGEINKALGVKMIFKNQALLRTLPKYHSATSKATLPLARFILAALQKGILEDQP